MDFVHRCDFCGFSRDAASAAMLAPSCERCGCGLRSLRRSELRSPEVSDVDRLDGVLPPADSVLVRVLRAGLALAVIAAAARAGYVAAGPAIAITVIGVAGLASVPLVAPAR